MVLAGRSIAWLCGLHRSANAIVYGGKESAFEADEEGEGVACFVGVTVLSGISAVLAVKGGSAIRSTAERSQHPIQALRLAVTL